MRGAPGMPDLLAAFDIEFLGRTGSSRFLGKTTGAVVQYNYFEQDLTQKERMHPNGWRPGSRAGT